MEQLQAIKKYVPVELQQVLDKIVNKTFNSPSKYIRTISIASTFFASWTFLRWIYYHLRSKIYNYPPCYPGIPIIGAMISASNLTKFNMMVGNMGPIMLVRFGGKDIIYISSMELIKEESKVYRDMIDRDSINLWGEKDNVNQFIFSDGESWHNRRRIGANAFLNQLNKKHLTKGIKAILDESIFPNIDKFNNKRYTNMRYDVQYPIFAMIFSTSFGEKVKVPKYDDEFTKLYFEQETASTNGFVAGIFFSFLFGNKWANYFNHKVFHYMDPFQWIEKTVGRWIEQYEQATINDDDNDNDDDDDKCYISQVLLAVKNGKITRTEMLRDTQSLFLAGVDTTAQTMEQAFFHLAKSQDTQQRLYQELAGYAQKYGEISLEHITELPILRAVVYETLRVIIHVANAFPKYVTKRVKIGGYNIDKGFQIFGNHYYINHSPKYWEKPMEFYIEHFLDKNNKFKLNKNMISFGWGKRDCMGQSLALKNLSLLIGNFILRYKILPTKETLAMDHVPFDGFISAQTDCFIQIREQ